MRFLRTPSILFVLSLLWAIPVAAQTPTPPPQVILQRSNSDNSIILSEKDTATLEFAKRFLGLDLTGLVRLDKLNVPDLSRFAPWLSAAQPALLPLVISQNIKHFTTPQTISAKYSVCMSQIAEGQTIDTKEEKSQSLEETEPISWINPLTENSKLNNSIWGRRQTQQNNEGVYHLNQPKAVLSVPSDCGKNDPAAEQTPQPFTLVSRSSLFYSVIQTVAQFFLNLFRADKADVVTQATVTVSTVTSSGEDMGCTSVGCTREEAEKAPRGDGDVLAKEGGFSQTFLATQHQNADYSFGKTQNQVTLGQKGIDMDRSFILMNKMEQFFTRTQCLLIPLGKQGQAFGTITGLKKELCRVKEPTGGFASANICAIAQEYNVPCEFLEAIWAIETGKSSRVPSGTYGNLHCCNAVGACGPMQIMGGLIPTIGGRNRNWNPCKEKQAFELGARLLLYKKCITTPGCQWDPENLPHISVSKDEIILTAYYYGTDGCIPDNVTQCRWGEGMSYCDGVQYYIENKTLPPPASAEDQALFCTGLNVEP